jgi:hypothetical protein
VATVHDQVDLAEKNKEAVSYASRLMGDIETTSNDQGFEVTLRYAVNFSGALTDSKIKYFIDYFKTEPPISAYDEIRKKNIQLIDLANRLRESEEQYKSLIDALPLMMFAINGRGEITHYNKGLKDFFSVIPVITSLSWQSLVHPDDYTAIWKEWDKSQTEKKMFQAQVRLRNKKGEYIWHLMYMNPMRAENLNVSWIGFFVDIHAQKMVNQAGAKGKEKKANGKKPDTTSVRETIQEFAFTAIHDFGMLSESIQDFSDTLGKSDLTTPQKEQFQRIVEMSARMTNLITGTLNY